MKAKTLISVLVGTTLSVSVALAADFSKKSNEELVNLSGKVAPKDYPDYKMEIHKRMQKMEIQEGRDFADNLRKNAQINYDKMTMKEYREYRDEIRKETEKRIDFMTREEARDSGLLRGGYGRGYGYGKGHRGHYRGDCFEGRYPDCPVGPRP